MNSKLPSSSLSSVREITGVSLESIDFAGLIQEGSPVILKGVFSNQALVLAGKKSASAARQHLKQYHSGHDIVTFVAPAEAKGRFFYNDGMSGFNFKSDETPLSVFFEKLEREEGAKNPEACYAGSTDLPTFFPNMIEGDDLSLPGEVFKASKPITSIWIGNRTTAATHYDMSNNVAACMVGRRRFTLFPPDQIENLYPGPIFPTPAGQVVSMVDLNAPDFKRYPKFKHALAKAQIAELEPGDLLVYPAMWWHQVEALDSFNILINYWWNEAKPHMDSPMNLVLYGMLTLRDRPMAEKEAWKHVFNYYVFGDGTLPAEHLPQHIQGPLAEMDTARARRLRMEIIKKINR